MTLTRASAFSFFKAVLEKHTKQCVPLTKTKLRKTNLYMTSKALNLKKLKNDLWAQYAQSKNIIDLARFK